MFDKRKAERKPRRLYRHEMLVLFIGYVSIIYWVILAAVKLLVWLDPLIK